MSARLPAYTRPATPPGGMRLQPRDQRILETLNAFDGLLSLRQIDRLFFSGQGASTARHRLRRLFHNAYLDMAPPEARYRLPAGETVYWLGKRGLEVLAGLEGKTPARLPARRWSLVPHDLRVNDLRITLSEACQRQPEVRLQVWVSERAFRSDPDRVTFRDQHKRQRTRQVIPDGFFTLRRPLAANPGRLEEFAFLLEMDMATEDNPRIGRDKLLPGVAYLRSAAYRQRFGLHAGRWLVVTTGPRRLENMRTVARRLETQGLFYFATFGSLTPDTILAGRVWHTEAAGDRPRALLEPLRPPR